jgi:NTE family protein
MEEVNQRNQEIQGNPVGLRVGVALGAGSAASMAQIGALEVLDEAGIPVHCVAGASAGALVGAAYAAGRLAEFRGSMEGLSRRNVLRLFDVAWPRQGLLHGRRALEFVRSNLGDQIESLGIPFAAVATDLRSGDEVALTHGAVFDAVRASIAIPGIFTPWRVGGRLLVDGALVNPVPVSTARALGAEFVIAISVLPPRVRRKPDKVVQEQLQLAHAAEAGAGSGDPVEDRLGLVEIVWQASRILASQLASHRLRQDRPGYLLEIPVPEELGLFDYHRTRELADLGRQCAERALPELRHALARAVPWRRRLREFQRRAAALLAFMS